MSRFRILAKTTPVVQHPRKPQRKNSWTSMFSKLVFNLAGYNKYGLYSDDVIYHDSPVVKEALRRLPKEVLDARNFRYFRLVSSNYIPPPTEYSRNCTRESSITDQFQEHTGGAIGLFENESAQGKMDHVRAGYELSVSAAVHNGDHNGEAGG